MNAQIAITHMASNRMTSMTGRDPRATRLFDRAHRNPQPNRVKSLFGQQIQPIRHLSDVVPQHNFRNRYYDGSQVIAVNEIHGTFNRGDDFDYDFRPLKASDEGRWCRVATAMLNGVELPPIEVIKVGDEYFVKDGHHRVSVAQALGFRYLDAIVEVWAEA